MMVKLSLLQDAKSLEEIIHCSKQKIKKFRLKKAILNKGNALELPLDLVNDGHINPSCDTRGFKLIEKNSLVTAFDKPIRVHSHPFSYTEKNNCLSYLRHHSLANLEVNRGAYDRGLLYRLDYETSGLMIHLNDELMHKNLREDFHQLLKEKIYFAIVEGKVESANLRGHYQKYGPKGSTMKLSDKGEEAILSFDSLFYNPKQDLSLLRVKLGRGIRHQIRVQLKDHGHSILGDELYGGRVGQRLFLHAFSYSFDYDRRNYSFQTSLPEEFISFFPELRRYV